MSIRFIVTIPVFLEIFILPIIIGFAILGFIYSQKLDYRNSRVKIQDNGSYFGAIGLLILLLIGISAFSTSVYDYFSDSNIGKKLYDTVVAPNLFLLKHIVLNLFIIGITIISRAK
jgi:hypothetical protein